MFYARSALCGARIKRDAGNRRCSLLVPSARGVEQAALDADVKRAVEKAERAADSWRFEVTDFYPPPVYAEVLQKVSKWADVSARAVGGYANAERCKLVVAREELVVDEAAESDFVAALQVSGNFMFDPASHRDFLGACLGCGIDRRTVGDIIVTGEKGAQIICSPDIADFIAASLTQVRTVTVTVEPIPIQDLQVPTPKVTELNTVESSMRVDAVASAGLRMSRSKMAELIKRGDVRVNWLPCSKASQELQAGDLIAVAGKGRVKVDETSITGKGKHAVRLVQYK
eukprot:jgi/Ulvmu1/8838/UM049_0018.1